MSAGLLGIMVMLLFIFYTLRDVEDLLIDIRKLMEKNDERDNGTDADQLGISSRIVVQGSDQDGTTRS